MEEQIGNRKTIVSKVFVTIVALAMIVPIGLIIAGEQSPAPVAGKAPIVDDFYEGNTQIMLAEAIFDTNVGPQDLKPQLQISEYGSKVDGYYIVQFTGAVQQSWKARLEQLGAKVGDYVPYNAFMVKMSAEVKDQVEAQEYVQYVGIYQPAYKIFRPFLSDMVLKDNLFVEESLAYIKWDNLFEKALTIGDGPKIPVTIFVQENENPYNVAALIGKCGGTVTDISDTAYLLRAEVSLEGIQVISFLNEVQYIQPYYAPEMQLATANIWEQTKSGSGTPVWDEGLHGEGVIVGTSDTGLDTDHVQFFDPAWTGPDDWTGPSPSHRKVVRYEQWSDDVIDYATSQHGTHTAGYCVGDGDYVGNTNNNRFGMGYHAKISFADIGSSDDTLSGIPADLKELFQIQYDDGARLCSNSWGVGVGWDSNGDTVDDARTWNEGTYSEDSGNADWFMWQNKEFLVFFSAGNDRSTSTYGEAPYNCTVTPPATGKNMVSVGASNSGTNWMNMESYSSFGPTRGASWSAIDGTGRLKPDVCSDGSVSSAHGDRNRDGNQDSNFQSMSGTSTSGPIAMGGAILINQYYNDGYYPVTATSPTIANGFEPSAALVKATLINGARDATSGSGTNTHDYNLNGHTMDYPNNDQGWGKVDLDDSLYFWGESREMEVDDNQVGLITGQFREYKFKVDSTSTDLEITLAWTDYKGTAATCGALVNDLELTVISPGGAATYYGNNFGTSSRQSDSSNPAGRDHVNNVEGVIIKGAAITLGEWTVRVDATNIPVGPQPYALVCTGAFDDGFGWIKLDKSVYAKGDTINIDVKDIDIVSGSLDVTVVSSTGDSETVTLTEVGPNARRFVGTITTAIVDPEVDGVVSIENGGWISARYEDASPVHTSYANATTDVSGPQISNVYVTDISNSAAMVHWTTDVPATSQVYYGDSPALGSSTALDGDMVFHHTVVITGLSAFTDYYYDVESTSIGGVTTRDANGGTHYMFTTVDNPDVLIVQEHSDVESSDTQVNDWRLSLGYYGWSFTVWETVKYGLPSVSALNSAKVVYWDVGEGYPQLGSDERAILQTWFNQGGTQLWYQTGQDVGWDMCDSAGTDRDPTWFMNNLHGTFERDDADGGSGNEGAPPFQIVGTTHAISNVFPGNTVGQDLEQDVYGNGRFWPDDLTNDQGGQNPAPWDYNRHAGGGDCGGIAYSGVDFKLAYEGFAHAQIQDDGTYNTPGNMFGEDLNMDRATIADYTLRWLFGEDHPDITVLSPNGGESVSGASVPISWTIANANTIDVQISADGGQSYVVEATGLPGSQTSYSWDTTTYQNGASYRVKILGYGTTLKGFDVSDGNFTVNNGPSGDNLGPIIWAGSVSPTPIPVERNDPLHITAMADDRMKGNSNILTVEYYIDGTTAAFLKGPMTPVDAFDSPLEEAWIDYVVTESIGTHTIYVRARDYASNWGGFESIDFEVIQGPNTEPWVTLTTPDGGEVWMGGVSNDIIWEMGDDQDSVDQLTVDIYYSTDGGSTFPNTIATGLSGFPSSPCTYSWDPTPTLDLATLQVLIVVTDTGALQAQDDSAANFEIDSTPPDPATGFAAELTVPNHVTVSWTGSISPDIDHYEIYYLANTFDPTGASYNFLANTGGVTTFQHNNVGINNPSTYYYQVRTYDVAGHETITTIQAAKTGSTQSTFANPSGWFMLGSALVQSDTSYSHVIQGAGLPAAYDYVQLFDAWDTADPWKSYMPTRPVNDLTDITHFQGFWLHITTSTRFATAGYIDDLSIPMKSGWNLVAYPFGARQTTTGTIIAHLTANCPGYSGIEIFDYTQPYRVTTPGGSETLLHGSAIWVHVDFDTTWTVLNY